MDWLFIFFNYMSDEELLCCIREVLNNLKLDANEYFDSDDGYRAIGCKYFTVMWFAGEKLMQDFANDLNIKYNTVFDFELYIQLLINTDETRGKYDDVVSKAKQFIMTLVGIIQSDYIFMSGSGTVYYTRVNGNTISYGYI